MTTTRAMHAKKTVRDAASGLQDVIDSGEDLLESLKDQQGAAVEQLRAKVSATISNARRRLDDSGIAEAASAVYDDTVGLVRNDPWRVVAIGALTVLAGSVLYRLFSND